MTDKTQKTPLYDHHVQLKANMVDFAGWLMPIHYGSQMAEHHAVRKSVGVFDVSHMGVVEVKGTGTLAFLRYLLANDVAKLKDATALYSCMLNEQGGVIDDLIVYRVQEDYFRIVINAGCREKDMAWMQKQAATFDVTLTLRDDVCLIALQGPQFLTALSAVFSSDVVEKITALKPFQFCITQNTFIARTGYTGEPGVEMILPTADALMLWEKLIAHGVQPCGLGARDTLRLEAGYNLFGSEMTESTSPLISNLAWTVSFKDENRDFIGKSVLKNEKPAQKLVGLILEDRGVLRSHQKIKIEGVGEGETTSGSFSPTLNKSIALARIPVCDAVHALVDIRGKWLPVKIVKPTFIK